MTRLGVSLAAILLASSALAQTGTGPERAGGPGKDGPALSGSARGGPEGNEAGSKGRQGGRDLSRASERGSDSGGQDGGARQARGAEEAHPSARGEDARVRGAERRKAEDAGGRFSTREVGGSRRYVTIRGQRVVYGSPEYRRLVVVERREARPTRYVVIQGRRVLYGSPEYYRLVKIKKPAKAKYVVIKGRRVLYGSPEYRRLTISVERRERIERPVGVRTDVQISTRERRDAASARVQVNRGATGDSLRGRDEAREAARERRNGDASGRPSSTGSVTPAGGRNQGQEAGSVRSAPSGSESARPAGSSKSGTNSGGRM